MINCADLGCTTGKGSGLCRIIRFLIKETNQSGFVCNPCGLTWWTEKIETIPEITDKYFCQTPSELNLFESILGSKPSELYLEKYRPIIDDSEFINYYNNLCDLRMTQQVKGLTSREDLQHTGILQTNRISILNSQEAIFSANALNAWITYPKRTKPHVGRYIFPTYYPNVISREVWNYIKSVNSEIQILNQQEEPIPRPDE